MNFQAVGAIYTFEMARFFRTLKQSFLNQPVFRSVWHRDWQPNGGCRRG